MNDNKNNTTENDATGEIMSWVIIIIAMFAVLPVGLFMLFRKLSNSTKKSDFTDSTKRYGDTSTDAYTSRASRPATGHPYAPNVSSQTGAQAHPYAPNASQTAGYAYQNSRNTEQNASTQRNTAQNTAYNTAQNSKMRSSASTAASYSALRYDGAGHKSIKKQKKRKQLEKKTGKAISILLLLSSVVMMFAGVQTIVGASINIWGNFGANWPDFVMGVLYILSASLLFGVRNVIPKRISRYKRYYAFAAGRELVLISDIALATGNSMRKVTRELQAMISEGYFGQDAYLDSELDCLVLSEEAAIAARRVARDGFGAEIFNGEPKEEKLVNQYMEIILELRDLNEKILDIVISEKIDRIEELTSKIFRIVEENPSKLPQIRRFMNYYLPTTLKLLHSYATLEKQGVGGENITAAKENIGRILDTLAKGYEQQLDQLFQSDVIDIAADINVLENLMQQDGLASDKSTFKTTSGGFASGESAFKAPIDEKETGESEFKTMEGTM